MVVNQLLLESLNGYGFSDMIWQAVSVPDGSREEGELVHVSTCCG